MSEETEANQDIQKVLDDLKKILNQENPTVDTGLVKDGELSQNWREAETSQVTETIGVETQSTPPLAANTSSQAPYIPPVPNFNSAPTPTWSAPNAGPGIPHKPKSPVRVGLLVWAGILIIAGLMVISQLLFKSGSGLIILVVLLASFGLVLVIAASTVGAKSAKSKLNNPVK